MGECDSYLNCARSKFNVTARDLRAHPTTAGFTLFIETHHGTIGHE